MRRFDRVFVDQPAADEGTVKSQDDQFEPTSVRRCARPQARAGMAAGASELAAGVPGRHDDRERLLDELRPHAFAIAYRMLGSVSEAEDVAQEAEPSIGNCSKEEVRYLPLGVSFVAMDERGVPFEDRVLSRLLDRGARRWGDRPLVRWSEGSLGYVEARERIAAAGGALQRAGVGRGDRVAIMARNRIELLETWLGCGWTGAIAVPLNVALRGQALQHALANSAPALLVCDGAQLEHLDRLDGPLPERVWVLPGDGPAPGPAGALRRSRLEPYPGLGDPVDPAPLSPGDPWSILYTSGTTGPSKGVVCPHGQLYWYGELTARNLGVREGDVLHTVLPMFHTNALNTFVQALLHGGVYSFGLRFSASRFWDQVRDCDATVTYLLGAMVHILLGRDPDRRDREHSLRVALSPATPADHVDAFRERFGVELIEGYGSTETSMVMCNRRDGELRPGAMGWVADGFEARVVDEHDRTVPDGAPGELVLRASEPFSMASGYFAMPDKTVEAWRNLWFHTGDRVVRDPDGVFRFLDRKKDSIRRRGENISSYEVEQALLTHRDVATCAVVPVPSELGEDEVMAFVVAREGAAPEPRELAEHCEPRLAYFAVPRFIELVDALPLTENGKVRKAVLRERGVSTRTWDAASAAGLPGRPTPAPR